MNRILSNWDTARAEAELAKINVSSGGIESMAPKMNGICLKLENVELAAANILKQEMLSLGGDAAVARGVVNGTVGPTDVILMGNEIKLKRLAAKLDYQQYFKLPLIKKDILKLLNNRLGKAVNNMQINGKVLDFSSTRIMGILNVTPDSFSDGNKYLDPTQALAQARKMIDSGADIIDIGGESTRPGAQKVSIKEELNRVIQIIKTLRSQSKVIISIDTSKAQVARQALDAGADMVNDISALRFDPDMVQVLKDFPSAALVLMHMQGTPTTMQDNPQYYDTIKEITDFLAQRLHFCAEHGINPNRIIIDPGIGFGKKQQDNLLIMQRLSEFHCLGQPLLLAASRKSFINSIYKSTPSQREEGTLAATAIAHHAAAHLIRVHDVEKSYKLLKVLQAVRQV